MTNNNTTLPRRSTEDFTLGGEFFLSKTNPLATADQRDLEALALKVLKMPAVESAKAEAARRYKTLAGHNLPAEAWLDFDSKMEEYAFHYVMLAVNGDPNYPKVFGSQYGPPHEWFGMKVPGNRGPGTGENVDNNAIIFALDGHSRYELHGKRLSDMPGDCPFHITGTLSQAMNISSLGWRDVQFADDDTFVITIDPEPANGRPNHLQTDIDTRFIFIRDARVDWRRTPCAYRIRRLDPPTAPPQTIEQMAVRAARFIIDDVATGYWYRQMVHYVDVNTVAQPEGTAVFGGQPSQKLGRGHFKLEDDEAFVLTLTPGGSEYWLLVLYDSWLMSGDFWNKTSSMNSSQSVANADGTYTYVFSNQDPGVHNWIDTLGLHETLLMIRWQLLPRTSNGVGGAPSTTGGVVKLKDLRTVLPAETKWMTPDDRKQQLAKRLAEFSLRYTV